MVTPTAKEQRMSIWDHLRFRLKIDVTKAGSKQGLIQQVRSKLGLRKFQRSSGKQRSILGMIKKSDFWKKSKYEDRFEFIPTKDWKEGEVSILKGLRNQGLKGKELHAEFNKRVTPNRSYMAVHVKSSRLGLKVKK